MRVFTTLAAVAALGAGASVAEQTAEVFILEAAVASQAFHSQAPSVPKELARHILLYRTTAGYKSDFLSDIPSAIDPDVAVTYIAKYGRDPAALFAHRNDHRAAQLVVLLEGMTDQIASPLKEALANAKLSPAFTIADPPSQSANTRLLASFGSGADPKSRDCDFGSVVNPLNQACWRDSSMVVRYDLQREPKTMQTIVDNFERLAAFAASGDLDTTLVLLPESSRQSKLSAWSTLDPAFGHKARDLAEEPTFESSVVREAGSNPTSSLGNSFRAAKTKTVHGCLQSLHDCQTQTNNCSSGRGACRNRNGKDTSYGPNECFLCQCTRAVNETTRGRQTTYYAGSMCEKVDKSTPFWLIAGSAIALAGAVAFAISLLFNVGEEELPGVIGAGVSRSK